MGIFNFLTQRLEPPEKIDHVTRIDFYPSNKKAYVFTNVESYEFKDILNINFDTKVTITEWSFLGYKVQTLVFDKFVTVEKRADALSVKE